jgi:hypothetical protein
MTNPAKAVTKLGIFYGGMPTFYFKHLVLLLFMIIHMS